MLATVCDFGGSSFDDPGDLKIAIAGDWGVLQSKSAAEGGSLDIRPQGCGFVSFIQHLGHGRDALRVDPGESVHVFEDTAQIMHHARNLLFGKVQIGQVRDVSDVFVGELQRGLSLRGFTVAGVFVNAPQARIGDGVGFVSLQRFQRQTLPVFALGFAAQRHNAEVEIGDDIGADGLFQISQDLLLQPEQIPLPNLVLHFHDECCAD